jgi:hypothetical protein
VAAYTIWKGAAIPDLRIAAALYSAGFSNARESQMDYRAYLRQTARTKDG